MAWQYTSREFYALERQGLGSGANDTDFKVRCNCLPAATSSTLVGVGDDVSRCSWEDATSVDA